MSSELSRQLRLAARSPGSYTQSALQPLESVADPYGQLGYGFKGADSPGASTTGTNAWVEKDPALRTYHPLQTVTAPDGTSMDITPIKTVTFENGEGAKLKLEYAVADLQKMAS